MKNFLLVGFLLLIGGIAFIHSLSKNSDCFSPAYVAIDQELVSSFEISSSDFPLEAKDIFKQPFYFLGSGHQSFAFESQDGQYVLKLIKFHCLENRLSSWNLFEGSSKEKKKLKRVLEGFSCAELHDKKHCGLILTHLTPTENAIHIVLYDKAGRKHSLNLAHYIFALQKKANPTGMVFRKLLDQGNVEEALRKIAALLEMFSEEFRYGIYDHDHNIIHNTGFVKEKPIRIDFGKLTLDPSMKEAALAKKELSRLIHQRILPWIKKYYPSHLEKISLGLKEIETTL